MKASDSTRFGIGTKLIIGLGTLIVISVVIGTLAIMSMLTIQATSDELSREYLPETVLANEVERETLKVMYNIRGYWLTTEAKYYDEAVKQMASNKKALDDLQVLMEKSPKLVKLREALPKALAAYQTYEGLMAGTKSSTDAIVGIREKMDPAAAVFMKNLTDYLEDQQAALDSEIRAGSRSAVLTPRVLKLKLANEVVDYGNALRVANFKTQALRDKAHIEAVMGNFKKIEANIAAMLKVTTKRINIDQLSAISKSAGDYQAALEAFQKNNTDLDALAAQRLVAGDTLGGLAEETSLAAVNTSVSLAAANSSIVSASVASVLIGLIVSLLLGIIVAFILIRSITVPLALVTGLSRKVTAGDFNIDRQKVKSRDELGLLTESFYDMVEGLKAKAALIESIANGVLTNAIPLASDDDGLGRSMQRMQESLNEILTQVNVAVDQMASGSDQVSTAAQSLSQGATEQASSLEEISASANEIHSQSKQNAENAMTATQLAKQASQNAQMGNQQMKDLMALLEKMTKSSEETKTIVKTIDDIAFQVNLLALNANVEAARAGKYGKGFAVVAEEVRNLAVRSATAVNETTRMVEESIRNIQDVNITALKTGDQLNGILGNANKVSDFLEEIAASSQEQARAMGQINGGLDQIDQVTQSNTASAEESASASEELSGQAQQLKVMISRFQLSDEALEKAMARSQATDSRKPHHASAPTGPSKPTPATPAAKKGPSAVAKPASGPKGPTGPKPVPANDIILNDDFDTF